MNWTDAKKHIASGARVRLPEMHGHVHVTIDALGNVCVDDGAKRHALAADVVARLEARTDWELAT